MTVASATGEVLLKLDLGEVLLELDLGEVLHMPADVVVDRQAAAAQSAAEAFSMLVHEIVAAT